MALTCEQRERFEAIVEKLRPEAKEFVSQMLNDPQKTTKDNYGKVMGLLSGFKDGRMGFLFLMAMEREGYPKSTANQLRQIMGW